MFHNIELLIEKSKDYFKNKGLEFSYTDNLIYVYKNNQEYCVINESLKTNSDTKGFFLFLAGIKPSMYISTTFFDYISEDFKKDFYIIHISKNRNNKDIFMYFITSNLDFYKKVSIIDFQKKGFTKEEHELLGTALGFPPIAIYDFNNTSSSTWGGIDYHGFIFSCQKNKKEQHIKWMQEHYDIPYELQTTIIFY